MRAAIAAPVVAAFLTPSPAWACRCDRSAPDFWQVAETAEVVVVAEITRRIKPDPRRSAFGFEIRVIEVVKGQDSRETIELVNWSPDNCSLVPPDLEEGARWAIVLMPGRGGEGDFGICRPRIKRLARAGASASRWTTVDELKRRLADDRPKR